MIRRGFLLGKFMPIHEGHILLCEIAAAQVDQLTVLLCSRDCEPINGHLRLEWARDSLHGNINVIHLHRDIPQEPSEHADFWAIWRQTIQQLHPEPIDWVFGSESYVLRLAEELDAQAFIFDQPRELIQISATLIRAQPQQYWDYIPAAVRPYFQHRIVLLGAESTGKTQLCQALAEYFKTRHIPEYGRNYDAVFKQDSAWLAKDLINIATGHAAIQHQIARRSGYLLFEDTDFLQTLVWAEYLLGQLPPALLSCAKQWQPATHYLLLTSEVEWHDDGTRYSADADVRRWFFERLQQWLVHFECSYQIITGADWPQRTKQAIQYVKKHLT